MSIAAGETLLGEVAAQRRRHGIASLCDETGVPRGSLTMALIAFGLPADSKEKYLHVNDTFAAHAQGQAGFDSILIDEEEMTGALYAPRMPPDQ